MNEYIKKYWFVGLTAILMFIFIIAYAFSSFGKSNGKVSVKEKTKDGESVIYSLNNEDVKASDLFENIKNNYGNMAIFRKINKLIADSVETTKELKTNVNNVYANYRQKLQDEQILNEIKAYGYTNVEQLYDYIMLQFKLDKVSEQYFEKHKDDLIKPFVEKNPGKLYAHILIKVNDAKVENKNGKEVVTLNPTKEEKEKLENVLKRIKNEDFALVASQTSEDTGSAKQGGMLGYVDEDVMKGYVAPFAEAAKKLKDDEISPVVETQFGYHIIKCYKSDVDNLIKNGNFRNTYFTKTGKSQALPIYEKAKELKIEILDENVKKVFEEMAKGKGVQ